MNGHTIGFHPQTQKVRTTYILPSVFVIDYGGTGLTSVLSFHIQLNSVRISRDNKGVKPGWLLDRITIDVDEKDEHYVFYCNRWIGSSDNAVDFTPGKQTF